MSGPRKAIPKLSAKRRKSLGDVPVFSTIQSPKKPIKKRAKPMNRVNKIRKATAFARAYGSHERVEFVKSLPCAACGVVGYSENAHLLGNGGMSRKADADTIGPLCGQRPMLGVTQDKRWMGCHTYYDEWRSNFKRTFPYFNPEKVATETHLRWEAHLDASKGEKE